MELYLDSVDFSEIEAANKLGFLTGLTTTPTFLHRQGITNVDEAIIRLSKMVNILHVEALGDTAEQILAEAQRLVSLGLDPERTVFKIPVGLEGVRACHMLKELGMKVNMHLIYTLPQAYMAMMAGATYICILAGRFQDQGYDAITLIEQTSRMVKDYDSVSKVMFSSVRNIEHVRNAITIGVDTITVPWSVMKKITENHFTTVGTDQFVEHTRLLTVRVGDTIRDVNPTVRHNDSLLQALITMTDSGFGAVSVLDSEGRLIGVFTDGDLRRQVRSNSENLSNMRMSDFSYGSPLTISSSAMLHEAVTLLREKAVDNLVVTEGETPIGMIDVQDLVKLKLVG